MPKKTAADIDGSGNGYCLPVKGNQKTLYREILHMVAHQTPLSVHRVYEKDHGRHSHWTVSLFDASHSPKAKQWQGLKRFIQIERCGTRQKGQAHAESTYYISNVEEQRAEYFHEGIRGRWHIENRLHWVKDVVHGEDGNKIRKNKGPVNASIFSTIAINMHRLKGIRPSPKAK